MATRKRENFGPFSGVAGDWPTHAGRSRSAAERQWPSRARPKTTGIDRDVMRELELFVDNDGDLYRQQTQSIEKNLYLKIVKGTYSKALAPKMWGYLLESGAKKYAKELGDGRPWHVMFPPAERQALSEEYARHFEQAVANDEYRHLDKTLPKKYRRTH